MRVCCFDCGTVTDFRPEAWCCECGGAWEPVLPARFDPALIRTADHSLWRYGPMLGLDLERPARRMGVGWTPLVPVRLGERDMQLKLAFLSPSGSFKDRGVNAMVNQLSTMGVTTVVEDSSGNAGASLAAHAARFGLEAEIYVPAYASPAKQAQIAVYGAQLKSITGPREAAARAAQAAVGPGRAYASHAYNPAYLAGQVSAAYEIWEQLGRRAPDWIILPVAQGGLFLGLAFGFRLLRESGLVAKRPRLVAVQPERIAPIAAAWETGLDRIPAVEQTGPTLAEGVAVPRPVRDKRILEALRETEGRALTVSEGAIAAAQDQLARAGYYVEPTSALALAGFLALREEIDEAVTVVLPLTGTGLKGEPTIK
ncbi:MAG: pyridoxal-phosphate dependent enzyme [Chloroflexota bacterium]|nr:pyridoxal-phosphate dependent enzyme [Chloroflexota bacterium]